MKSAVATKLKKSDPTMTDPQASVLIGSLLEDVTKGKYVTFTSAMFADSHMVVFDDFIDQFLFTQAEVTDPASGTKVPAYDPFEIAYTESRVSEDKGPMYQWLGYYTNCFLFYTEYPDSPEHNNMMLCVERETYETIVKFKDFRV